MHRPPLDPDVADTAPSDSVLTAYDEEHLVTACSTRMWKTGAKSREWCSPNLADITGLVRAC
jgi:hypothetical protein